MKRFTYVLAFTATIGMTACGGDGKSSKPAASDIPSSSSVSSKTSSSKSSSSIKKSSSSISSASSKVNTSSSKSLVSSSSSNTFSTSSTSSKVNSSSNMSSSVAANAPTYWGDVAPIIYKNCTSCHTEGGIAPFALTTYDQAKLWSKSAALAMSSRIMPPWPMTGDGSCGEYKDSKWLSDADIKTVNDWASAGAPAGTPRDDLKVTQPVKLEGGTQFKTPNFTPKIVGGLLAQFDEYRCFAVDPKLTKDQFITGYEVIPGNKAMIHHALVYSVDPLATSDTGLSNGDQIKKLQNDNAGRDGWPCFGTAGDGIKSKGIPVSWAPGQGATYFPDNTGFRVKATDQLVFQIHYNLDNAAIIGQSDQTSISLLLKDSVPQEGFFILHDPLLSSLATGKPDVLLPGKAAFPYTWTLEMAEYAKASPKGKLDLYGSIPHMHQRGKSFSAKVLHAGGASECTADIKAWDFHWQLYYFYQKPFTLSATDAIQTTCTYDTSKDTSPVMPGWGTHNEMCLYGMFIVPQK